MQKLKETIEVRGEGIKGVVSTLVFRTNNKFIYKRSDGYYEVFKRRTRKEGKVFGVDMPEREVYPGNNDFGDWAWCIRDYDRAIAKYNAL